MICDEEGVLRVAQQERLFLALIFHGGAFFLSVFVMLSLASQEERVRALPFLLSVAAHFRCQGPP